MKNLLQDTKRSRLNGDVLYLVDILNNVKYDGIFHKIYDKTNYYLLFIVTCNNICIMHDNISNSLCVNAKYDQHYDIPYKDIIEAIKNSQFENYHTSWNY